MVDKHRTMKYIKQDPKILFKCVICDLEYITAIEVNFLWVNVLLLQS